MQDLEPSFEGAFQLVVETLDDSNGLCVVGCRVEGRNPEQVVEFRPQTTGELRATVRSDIVRHSETGDPVMDEGPSTGFCGRVGKWDGFGPTGEAVDNCEEVLHALRLIERTQ